MAACTRNPYKGSAGSNYRHNRLLQFREWKAMNELESAIALRTAVAPRKPNTVYKWFNDFSTTNEAKVAKKKGWSKAAKYSVIGAGSGAILGAVINKRNRVAGGIIGGVLGGGVGYGIGRSNDKKDGRL
ncbi:MAG: glycine zipper 2TM domain-containing protein [Chitinophagaceae bacterium]|nr:glycine zipper 2TM domain-containing protein [Chitinophagaceae bacterium]